MGRDRGAAAAREPEGVGEIAFRQAILHALVAAAGVQAALRAWRIRRPESRLRFWLLALAFPFLVLPVFLVAVPFRSGDRFAAGWALFSADRWNAVRLAGTGADTIAFGLLAAMGTLLFLRDVVPFLLAMVREHREGAAEHRSPSHALLGAVANLSRQTGCPAPAVVVLQTGAPVLFVHGVRRHRLVVSEDVLARLSPGQLQAAVAHELGHVRFRDPLAGWVLMGARLVMFWNPAVQLMARAIVQEMECRADRVAADITTPDSFAAALRELASLPGPRETRLQADCNPVEAGSHNTSSTEGGQSFSLATSRARIEMVAERLHHAHIAARITSVLGPPPEPQTVWTRLTLVGATLAGLLFFVV